MSHFSSGILADGSWSLRIIVTDYGEMEKELRVKGDMHIGGVMLKLVEDLEQTDWSDHALWWPDRNKWLHRTKSTLDQYGVQSDAVLHFTPMHKQLTLQLPDLRYIEHRVDVSIKVFNAVCKVCKELGIRYPEELSFKKPLKAEDLKQNYSERQRRKVTPHKQPDTNTYISNGSSNGLSPGPNHSPRPNSAPISSPALNNTGTWRSNHSGSGSGLNYSGGLNGSYSPHNTSFDLINGYDTSLAMSPMLRNDTRISLLTPKNLIERARMNVSWLDSSLSLMEQGVREFDTVQLRYKFSNFYDLNPKYDAVRINQLYEQGRWQLINEEIDCTEEEMMMFAALQLQVNIQNGHQQPDPNQGEDDIDAALTDLQTSLEGSAISPSYNDIMKIPELADYLRFMKQKRFTLKGFKRYYFVCKDLHLYLYKSQDDARKGDTVMNISLRGSEVTPDVLISQNRYGIKLEIPSVEGMSEAWIRCDSEQQYAKWMAACRLASKGKTMADSTYDSEVKSILAFLSLQHPGPAQQITPAQMDINPNDYVSQRIAKRYKSKLTHRILEQHANVKDLNLVEAKMRFIQAWQRLPEFGIALFIVRFRGQKKEELLGIANNRLMKMDMNTGDHIKTWRFNAMKAWNVNWEVKEMMVQFDNEAVIFACLSADCKVVHEFIGGHIFLSMRSKDANQSLKEEQFHKLTGGWV